VITRFIYAVEGLNVWVGRAFGWCILILTLSVSYEVFVRYVLNSPTVWAFDMMVQMYGALFLMAGPYSLAQDAHVRGDVLYRLFPVRWQARVDFTLYLLFFFPGRHDAVPRRCRTGIQRQLIGPFIGPVTKRPKR
jgi:TRAP-type mannitol/chloroaromatic compound transport system permease small subunit